MDSVMEEALETLKLEETNRRSTPASSPSNRRVPFVEGDIVQVFTDREYVKVFQKGHGEWTNAMLPVIVKCFIYTVEKLP